jgi:hypothetical protein
MKVKELIERLAGLNPEAEVVFHEYMEYDGLMDNEFSPLRFVTPAFAIGLEFEGGDNDISIHEGPGVHSQGYKIETPVVALSTTKLVPCETNATSRILSGREQEVVDKVSQRRMP